MNWMAAREKEMRSWVWGEQIEELRPVIQKGGSDSACRISGSRACFNHGHPGGSVPPAPDPDDTKATDLGWQLHQSQQFTLQ